MAETRTSEYKPSSVSPPGETLAELLEEKGLTQAELARRLERPLKTINEIVKGKATITPDTALQLERALGAPADFWLARESAYREWLARVRASEDLGRWLGWLREVPVNELRSLGWIGTSTNKLESVSQCLQFFGVATVEAWRDTYERPLAAFRASTKVKRHSGAVAAWLRRGEIEALAVECARYDARSLESLLDRIRALTLETDPTRFVPVLTDLCRTVGLSVVFVPAPRGCPASGAARWLTPDKALIQLSLRYRTHDQLWFTFFHELGHILRHGKSLVFIDQDRPGPEDHLEQEANAFARDLLIPQKLAVRLSSLDKSHASVVKFAAAAGVAPGIVVGRMQHERLLPWTHLNDLKTRYSWTQADSTSRTMR